MATTFNWIYLGTSTTFLDPTEGNTVAENANSFVGLTYGSATDPLFTHVTSATMIDNGGTAGALDQNNSASNDQFTTNIGAGTQTFTFDGTVVYDATVTYANGTTATVTAVIAQGTAGHLFLAPDPTSATNADTAAYEAMPIVSIRLNAVSGGVTSYSGMSTDRIVTGFDDGYIEGTAGNDLINAGYVEPIANGTDMIDGGDGISSAATAWQDDRVRAGAGNDTVLSGLGNDFVDGGTGADFIDGGDGNDSLFGGAGAFNDTILGGLGNDTIDGGDGNDSLLGGAGADSILGGAGNDYIDGGDGNDTLIGGAGADTMTGGTGNDLFIGVTAGDVVNGSEDAGGGDTDVLDLFGSGWTFGTTNIIYSTPDHENGTVEFLDANGNVIGTMTFSNIESIIACFTPGTLIETDRGPVAVERLAVGDRVLTKDTGYQVLRWIGRRDLTPAELAAAPQLRPVLIRAGAFGPAMPERDMRLSPQHRLLLTGARTELFAGEDEVFAPALHFLGLPGVVRDAAPCGTSYLHLLFDRHEIVRSDGVWSESFQPAGAMFKGLERDQRDEVLALFPELAKTLSPANDRHYPAARSTVKRHETRLILAS